MKKTVFMTLFGLVLIIKGLTLGIFTTLEISAETSEVISTFVYIILGNLHLMPLILVIWLAARDNPDTTQKVLLSGMAIVAIVAVVACYAGAYTTDLSINDKIYATIATLAFSVGIVVIALMIKSAVERRRVYES